MSLWQLTRARTTRWRTNLSGAGNAMRTEKWRPDARREAPYLPESNTSSSAAIPAAHARHSAFAVGAGGMNGAA